MAGPLTGYIRWAGRQLTGYVHAWPTCRSVRSERLQVDRPGSAATPFSVRGRSRSRGAGATHPARATGRVARRVAAAGERANAAARKPRHERAQRKETARSRQCNGQTDMAHGTAEHVAGAATTPPARSIESSDHECHTGQTEQCASRKEWRLETDADEQRGLQCAGPNRTTTRRWRDEFS